MYSFINDKELNILKAILPFFPSNTRKFLAIYIAMKELSNIFALINAISSNKFDSESKHSSELDTTKIFESIKKFLSPSEIEMIDGYINMMSMMKMMNEMSSMFEGDKTDKDNNNSFGGLNMDMLKSMLTPEQSAIFESFSNSN